MTSQTSYNKFPTDPLKDGLSTTMKGFEPMRVPEFIGLETIASLARATGNRLCLHSLRRANGRYR